MNRKLYILFFLSLFVFQFCSDNAVKSEAGIKINFQFCYKDSENTELSKSLGTMDYDDIKIIFYDINLSWDDLYANYLERNLEISQYQMSYSGDLYDLENYWVEYDKGNLDILADGKYSVEKRSTLSIEDGRAYGEFYISEGMKSCRVGIYDDGVLAWVGTCYSDFNYIEVHTHDDEEDYDYYIYIVLEEVY